MCVHVCLIDSTPGDATIALGLKKIFDLVLGEGGSVCGVCMFA